MLCRGDDACDKGICKGQMVSKIAIIHVLDAYMILSVVNCNPYLSKNCSMERLASLLDVESENMGVWRLSKGDTHPPIYSSLS